MKYKIYLLLDNIRSVHNVGAIFRTADGVGISKIFCIGTTPVPIDRFGRKRKDFIKASLGAEDYVSWEYRENANSLLKELKKEGFTVIALEQNSDAIDYKKLKANSDGVIILGNEVNGVSKELLNESDFIVEIPMSGKKESLNVSVATGILLYSYLNR